MKRSICALVLALSVLIVAGCSAAGGSESVSDRARASDAAVEREPVAPAWSTDTPTLGNPQIVGDVVVAYVSPGDGQLEQRAWSTTDGHQLWSVEASPGAVAPGVALSPHVIKVGDQHLSVFVAPLANGWHTVMMIDVHTGAPHPYPGDQDAFWINDRPGNCSDADPKDRYQSSACFSAYTLSTEADSWYRLDPKAGIVALANVETTELDGARSVGPDLYATDGRTPSNPEELRYVVDGELIWSTTYREVFGEGYSSDYGWHWRRDTDNNLMLGWAYPGSPEGAASRDLSNVVSVALDLENGAVSWRLPGVQLGCALGYPPLDVACDYNGVTVNFGSTEDPNDTKITQGDIEQIGIDLETGKPTWTHNLGGWLGAVYSSANSFAATGSQIIVPSDDDGYVLLHLDDGTTKPVPWEVLPCTEDTSYKYPEWTRSQEDLVEYVGSTVYTPCNEKGENVELEEYPVDFLRFVGTPADAKQREKMTGTWVVPTPTGLQGFELTKRGS